MYDSIKKHYNLNKCKNCNIRICAIDGIINRYQIIVSFPIIQYYPVNFNKYIFINDGVPLKMTDSVLSLDMENNDIINAVVRMETYFTMLPEEIISIVYYLKKL